ncbi:methyltransferase [Pyruvatibacter sp.]|uniref:tRNA1(Val) (adenine(37)-N6)-methyltransferase n=1 Tax=Pyruvatibacter sp. TaxID=1981328 RepID=UPI0032F01373
MQTAPTNETTDDDFLSGQIKCLQPRHGFRAGLDTVMLSAACPARPGERVIEPGCGPGVAALCLASRTGAHVLGVEIEHSALALAAKNADRNNLADVMTLVEADVTAKGSVLEAVGLVPESCDHAIANPPFLTESNASVPPGDARARALAGPQNLLDAWVKFATRMVKPGGTLTFINRADRLAEMLATLDGRAGGTQIFPLWPAPPDSGKPASRIIVQATKGSRAPLKLLPGMVLHGMDGRFTSQAWAILRDGAPLPMSGS